MAPCLFSVIAMKLFGIQLVFPSFGLLTRAVGCAILVWVAVIYGARFLGLIVEPVPTLTPIIIGSLLFAFGLDVFKDLRHLVVGLGLYVVLNGAVDMLVSPLL